MPPKILILGAGLSGLSAAYELKKKGYAVQLLEAQGRPGGRVHTMKAPFADAMYADAGAMSFLDTQTHVLQYVHDFDLAGTSCHPAAAAKSTPSAVTAW